MSAGPAQSRMSRRLPGAALAVLLLIIVGCFLWAPGNKQAHPREVPQNAKISGGRPERISPGGAGAPDTPALPPAELSAPPGAVQVKSPGSVSVSSPALPAPVSSSDSHRLPP